MAGEEEVKDAIPKGSLEFLYRLDSLGLTKGLLLFSAAGNGDFFSNSRGGKAGGGGGRTASTELWMLSGARGSKSSSFISSRVKLSRVIPPKST